MLLCRLMSLYVLIPKGRSVDDEGPWGARFIAAANPQPELAISPEVRDGEVGDVSLVHQQLSASEPFPILVANGVQRRAVDRTGEGLLAVAVHRDSLRHDDIQRPAGKVSQQCRVFADEHAYLRRARIDDQADEVDEPCLARYEDRDVLRPVGRKHVFGYAEPSGSAGSRVAGA